MDEEIDLRIYLRVLLRYWMWIAGLTLAAAAAGFVFSLLLPPVFEAHAVVLVTEPRYQIRFDPRFGTEEQVPAYRAFPALSTSDRILVQVAEAYDPPAEAGLETWTAATVSGMIEATLGFDPSLLQLRTKARVPQMAADLANVWADVVVEEGNRIYSDSDDDVVFFQEQLEQALEALDGAEAALIEFEARDKSDIVRAQLDSLRQAQDEHLANQRRIADLVQDIQGLREQLADQPGDQAASLGDSLTTLFLQIKAFNAGSSADIQLQVESAAALSERTLSEQIAFLDDLAATLEERSSGIDERLGELEPLILSLQQTLQEIKAESNRLTRARSVAEETYVTMARKADEARIAAQEEKGMLRVGSYAMVPRVQSGPRRMALVGVAGMLGLMVGVVGALAIDFRRYGKR